MPLVTGADVLTQLRKDNPSPADEDFADICAAAVDAAITTRLRDVTPSTEATAELTRSALVDAIGAYLGRDTAQGVLTVGPDGAAVRIGADILRASLPVLERYTVPGIG